MKKALGLLLTLFMLCVLLTGCGKADGDKEDDKNSTAEQPSHITVATVKSLLEENYNCNINIFMAGNLPTIGDPITDNIYRVDPAAFESYADFKNYLLTVYTAEYVDSLLGHKDSLYIDLDGALCINLDLSNLRGYDVDWSDPKIEIIKQGQNTCTFCVKVTRQEPGDPPVKEELTLTGTAQYQNGRWVLDKMLY